MQYDVFVSYSHAADDLLSERVQDGLQRFAKPWWRRRELNVFRDRTGLNADPGLWSSIVEAMESSRFFLLLASPEAAASHWVNREVTHWRSLHGSSGLLVLQTDGEITWDEAAGDFDWARTTAIPEALAGSFPEEPRHVDMRWARSEEQLDLTNGRFRDQIAELSAPVHGVRKDDIAGEHVRQHRRTIRTVVAAAIALGVLAIASAAGAVLAVRSANDARANQRKAETNQKKADDDEKKIAANLVTIRTKNRDLSERNTALKKSQSQTEAQRKLALHNADVATRNADEAQRNADAATQNALQAARNADEAFRNAERARRNAEDAAHQRDLAVANAQEADRQKKIALNRAHDLQVANTNLKASNAAGLSRQLAAQALVELDNLDRALVLGAAAQAESPTPAAHSALLRLAESSVGVDGFLRAPGVTPDSPDVTAVVASSPDGNRRAEWTSDGTITVWAGAPARSAQEIAHFTSGLTVSGMAFSQDGSHLAAWDVTSGIVRSFDVSTASPVATRALGCDPHVSCAPVVTGDGELIAPEGDHTAILDITTLDGPSLIGRLGADGGGPAGQCAISSGARPLTQFEADVCTSPGGRFAMGRTAAGDPVLWDRANGDEPVVLHTASGTFTHVTVSSDDRVAAAVTAGGELDVFDPATGAEQATLAAPAGALNVAISPDRTFVASYDATGHLAIRRIADGSATLDVALQALAPVRLEYSSDGRWLAVAGGGRVRVVETATGRVAADIATTWGFAFDRSSIGHVLVQTNPSTLLVWDLTAASPISAATAASGFGERVLVSPADHTLAAYSANDKVTIYSLDDLTTLTTQRDLPGSKLLQSIAFADEQRLVGVEPNGTLIEWNLRAHVLGATLAAGRSADRTQSLLAVSPDGTALAAAQVSNGGLGAVTLERPIGTAPVPLTFFSNGTPERLAFTPRGTYLAMTDANGTVVYSLADGRQFVVPAPLVAFSGDEHTAASFDAGARSVTLWSLPGGQPRATISLASVLGGPIARVALDGDAGEVAVLDRTGQVVRWSVNTARELTHWTVPNATGDDDTVVTTDDGTKIAVWAQDGKAWLLDATATAPVGSVAADSPALAFSHDGSILATSGPQVQLWDTTTLEPLGDPLAGDLPANDPSLGANLGAANTVTANVLQFASSGVRIVEIVQSGGLNVDVRAVTVDAPSLAQAACATAGRTLTPEERQRFDPGGTLPAHICDS